MTFTAKQFHNIATKDDVKKIRDNLKKLEKDLRKETAAKDDLRDLKKEITAELGGKINKVFIDLSATKDTVKKIEDTMSTKEDIDKVLTAVDVVIGQYQEIKIEELSNLAAHERFEVDITKLKVHTGLRA